MKRFLLVLVVLVVVGVAALNLSPLGQGGAGGPGRDELIVFRGDSRPNLIVFVHGVRDTGKLTWTNAETNAEWPEMLSRDERFESFDISTYHYSSLLFQSGSMSISNVADQLSFRLDRETVKNYENVIFVAHSMGGLVVRNLLLKNDYLAEKVPLVYFLATPTAGADIARLAGVLDLGNRQLDAMTSFEASNFLQDQNSAWRASNLFSDTFSLCAFENQPTMGIIVVNQASAESLCTGKTVPSGESHSGVAKPYSEASIVYDAFADRVVTTLSTLTTFGCAVIPVDNDQPLYGGLDFTDVQGDRDCMGSRTVALEFFNQWQDAGSGKTLTSANFLIDGAAASTRNDDVWHEYSRFTPDTGNRFDWDVFRTGRERFQVDGCGFDRFETLNNQDVEYRRGTFFLSNPRTDHTKHSYEEWKECNRGGPEFPEFSHCNYIRYETFLPTTELSTLCAAENVNDQIGSFDVLLVNRPDYEYLVTRANKQVQSGAPETPGIDATEFGRIVSGVPKICMRNVDLEGEPIVGESNWRTFAHVVRILCDGRTTAN